ncbi:MAG: ATPase [Candidatus Synechococcus spongiarum 142]|uniref:ATPase n=1 Tax=Candidatus Synechococcus spongiarum 142 TaxID=1608213 RepID=A0A6N3X5Q8_9SYNE|nr:MAG: ATPase [Candidatus Synechococcus spongiarum 142]
MTMTLFEQAGSLRIGVVDFVSPDEVKVVLDIEAPESVELNTGGPRPFPRVNGYLLIPVDDGFLVGQTEWITVERSPFPKRRGMQDFGLVDLPYPLRKLRLNPLGTLRHQEKAGEYIFRRGAAALPSVGAAVLLPTETQLCSIVESGEKRRVKIGTSPIAGDKEVSVDPDRLFGRHLAVIGNTGSGKSCSIAGLIRWSLAQATKSRQDRLPNARFIVLDPNGEYSRVFRGDDTINSRIFTVDPDEGKGEIPLKVPLWFWNSAEWCSFTQASAKTQRPLLRRALREIKSGQTVGSNVYQNGPDEDVPLYFQGTDLANHLEALASQEKVSKYLDSLVARIRTFLSDPRIKRVIDSPTNDITLYQWLMDYIGAAASAGSCVSVIDLSLVPTEVVHVVTAVIARMTFEALQRYAKLNNKTLPTVMVMEEAHTFIKRYKEDVENQNAASVCCQVFERIAREGRKFGLGLVISSQRPSELSPTVLSQCNTYLLHRISNDRDQQLIHQLVPDNLRGLLRELPLLPSQNAILLGWASELPVLVKMNDLPEVHQPRSEDPKFWDVWTGAEERRISWEEIARDWQEGSSEHQSEATSDIEQVSQEPAGNNDEEFSNVPF